MILVKRSISCVKCGLFQLIVVRKYKALKNESPKRIKGKSKGVKVRGNRFA